MTRVVEMYQTLILIVEQFEQTKNSKIGARKNIAVPQEQGFNSPCRSRVTSPMRFAAVARHL
jgi:hypothetical protein